jgi:putative transposase
MPYCQLFYHIVTATKDRCPMITPELEPVVYRYLRGKALDLGATVFALNGVADHVHLVVSVPPRVALSMFVGQIKGYSSNQIHQLYKFPPFAWQDDYGVFSCDKKRLPNFISYVEGQKEHHRAGSLVQPLERCEEEKNRVAEETADYLAQADEWDTDLF